MRTVSLKLVVVLTMIGLVFSPALIGAQTKPSKEEKKVQKVRDQIKKLGVGEKVKIKIETNDGTTYEGHLVLSGDESCMVMDKSGTAKTVKYSDINKIAGKNLSTGAKIAIGVGMLVGAALLFVYFIYAISGGE